MTTFFNTLANTFLNIGIKDVIEILIIVFIFYKLIMVLKDSRAMIILKGILFVLLFYLLAQIFQFNIILTIFQWVVYWGAATLIIVFSGDIRKILEKMGTKIGNINSQSILNIVQAFSKKNTIKEYFYSKDTVKELTDACFKMGSVKTGALIVIERDIPLNDWITTGIEINGNVSAALLINIFEKNTPLHDGAVIMRGNKVKSATCYLPLSDNTKIDKNLGTRHRAAIGTTENSDAIVIVVSEETGNVSISINGKLHKKLNEKEFKDILYREGERASKISLSKKEHKNTTWKYKLISFILAIIFWCFLININDPQTTKTFTNIPVQILNESVITTTGQTYEIIDGEYANIKIKAQRSIINEIDIEDIKVVADMKKMSYVYAIPMEVSVAGYDNIEISIVGNSTTNIELEELVSCEVPITVNKIGESPYGVYIHEILLSNDTMTITSSASISKTLDEAVIDINISNIRNDKEVILSPVLYDKNGNIIPTEKYETSTKDVILNIKMYPTKLVPLHINVETGLNTDYVIKSVKINPESIYIAGEQEILDTINEFIFDLSVNFDGNLQFIKTVNLENLMPENIDVASTDKKATISVEFEPLERKTIEITQSSIELRNLKEGYGVTILNENIEVELKGLIKYLNDIDSSNITPYLDLIDLDEGEYNLILNIEQLDNVQKSNTTSVKIKIEKLKD